MINQINFSQVEFANKRKKTKKEIFFKKMEKFMPLESWCDITRPYYYDNNIGSCEKEIIFLFILTKS